MKKTITINLSGVVFHIEEDAYQVLQQYLESIKKYFQNVRGGSDIQGDIEARIAEIFSEAISVSKQAITIDDVNHVIAQMGSVEDMMDESDIETESANQSSGANSGSFDEQSASKKLFRDTTNAIVGGVFSGIAAYFGVNPLWIRLVAIAFTFGFYFLPSFAGTILIGYIILWISMPASTAVENRGQFKKFFRSRKDQVVSGVAGGLGAYANVDPVIIRILFVLTTFFGGVGLITYVILWAITPEAKTVTDELQMKGDPVTLNNIEEQIRKNVDINNDKTKNNVVKAVALPFKLMALVVTALGGLFKLFFDIIRFALGLLLLFISGAFLFAVSVMFLVAMGLLNQGSYNIDFGGLPLDRLSNEISVWMVGFSTLTAIIPIFVIFMVSISLMAKKNLLRSTLALVLVALFFVGLMGTGFTVLPLVSKFSKEGTHQIVQEFDLKGNLIDLQINQLDKDMNKFHLVDLQIQGWSGPQLKLVEKFEAQGSTWKEAKENAAISRYNVAQQDSTLIFDSNITIDQDVPYRMQRLKLNLYMPYGQKFKMDRALEDILNNTLYPYDYHTSELEGNVWMYDEKGLQCLTCPKKISDKSGSENNQNHGQDEDF